MLQYKGGNGSSKEKAIIIHGVYTEWEGVDAEYDFLESKYGNYELVSQEFVGEVNNKYDVLTIKLSDGSSKEVWFDVSDFYGREWYVKIYLYISYPSGF